MRKYTASLSRTQDRPGWSVIFRHPAKPDPRTGKPTRVRHGLGTTNNREAEELKAQIDCLLADQRYWEPSAKADAEKRFHRRVVEIFYHEMDPEETDFVRNRDEIIPLPSAEDSEYRRALLIGTTGSGKTTLVRQLIGTHPKHERFPSTSTAKTTIHDTEIVLVEGPFKAVVTFAPHDEVREHLNDCISNAVLAAYRGAADAEILYRLLNHVNQRFRFSYILGRGPTAAIATDDEESDEVTLDDEDEPFVVRFGAVDLAKTEEALLQALDGVKSLARDHGDRIKRELEASSEKDERVIDELFEEELDTFLREDEAFHQTADDLMDEITARFDALKVGTIRRTRQGWPLSWHWETQDREAFLREITRFSSNYAALFGTLLSPLVNGMRVSGPFLPAWATEGQRPNLILLDGEGLGHTPGSSSAIPTALNKRISMCDALILVDNAAQPMQAAPVAAMRELVASGNSAKLLLVFTHFDEVKGDNLPSVSARQQHVLASAENVLAALGEELGPFAERALRGRIEGARFFLGDLDGELQSDKSTHKRCISQLQKLLAAIDKIIERPEPVPAKPVYDKMNMVLAVREATERFHEAWQSRLGLRPKPGVQKEHWTRVKALSRRLANPNWSDEYDTLKPVADLRADLQARIYVFLQNPIRWEGNEPTEDEKQVIFDRLAESISMRMQNLASRRIRHQRQPQWQEAYFLHGTGSTFVRARKISREIYDRAAPIPDSTPSPDQNEFLRDVAGEVQAAADENEALLN